MANIYQMYQGAGRYLYVTIRDSNGVLVNPATFKHIEIRLVNEYSFETLIKWWYVDPTGTADPAPSGQGWVEVSNKVGGKVELFLNNDDTKNISTSHLRVQVNTVKKNTDFDDSEEVQIYSSVLARLLKAKQ